MESLDLLGKSLEELNINIQKMTGKTYEIHSQHNILKMLNSKPSSLALPRVVSIVYIKFYELYKNEVKFLIQKFSISKDTWQLVNNLRTYFNHSIDLNSKSDKKVNRSCVQWITSIIGTEEILEEDQWDKLLSKFVSDCRILINKIIVASQDKTSKVLCKEFEAQIISSEMCDKILEDKIDIFNLEFEVRSTRALYFNKWKHEYDNHYIKNAEQKNVFLDSLIEDSLIKNSLPKLPISGSELIDIFDIYEDGMLFSVLKDCYIKFQYDYQKGILLTKSDIIKYIEIKYGFNKLE